MKTQFSMHGIVNAALISQGLDEVPVGVDTPEYRVLLRNWPQIVEGELEDGLYSFSKEQTNLITRSPGKFGYEDAFLVPSKTLHVRHVWVEDALADWVQDGTHVHVNSAKGCRVEILVAADENLWSANFTRGVQARLEAVLARAVKEEFQEAMALEQAAENFFQRARTLSSKSRSAQKPARNSRILEARFGRGTR